MLSTRDLALKYINEGVSRYNSSPQYDVKKNGYDLYLKGIEYLITAAKRSFFDFFF